MAYGVIAAGNTVVLNPGLDVTEPFKITTGLLYKLGMEHHNYFCWNN